MGGYRGYGARQHARAHGAYPRRATGDARARLRHDRRNLEPGVVPRVSRGRALLGEQGGAVDVSGGRSRRNPRPRGDGRRHSSRLRPHASDGKARTAQAVYYGRRARRPVDPARRRARQAGLQFPLADGAPDPRRQIAAAGPVRPRRLQGRAPGTAYLKSRYETRSAATTHTRTNTAAPAPRRVSSMGRRRIERRAPRPSEGATARQAHRSPRLKGTSAIQTRNTPEVNDRTAAVARRPRSASGRSGLSSASRCSSTPAMRSPDRR